MKTDEDFRTKVTDCKDAESSKAFVLKEGFIVEELKDVRGCELNDEDWDASAGGIICIADNRIPSTLLGQTDTSHKNLQQVCLSEGTRQPGKAAEIPGEKGTVR